MLLPRGPVHQDVERQPRDLAPPAVVVVVGRGASPPKSSGTPTKHQLSRNAGTTSYRWRNSQIDELQPALGVQDEVLRTRVEQVVPLGVDAPQDVDHLPHHRQREQPPALPQRLEPVLEQGAVEPGRSGAAHLGDLGERGPRTSPSTSRRRCSVDDGVKVLRTSGPPRAATSSTLAPAPRAEDAHDGQRGAEVVLPLRQLGARGGDAARAGPLRRTPTPRRGRRRSGPG